MAKRSVEVQVLDSDFSVLLRESVTYEFKMETRSKNKFRNFVMFCMIFAVTGIVYFGYFCSDQVCALTPQKPTWSEWPLRLPVNEPLEPLHLHSVHEGLGEGNPVQDNLGKPLSLHSKPYNSKSSNPGLSYDDVLNENFQFDMNGHDVMVFLHIQKTGGTSFGKHLVQDLDLQRPCTCHRKRKRCYCFRPNRNENWLFSRYSTGWKCGLHADWTELTSCVDAEFDKNEGDTVKRKYFYITLLREPVTRYVSEFRHVQRGATWKQSRHWCGGREASSTELPLCYSGESWLGVTLDDFMACPSNLAHNRQTRMLADLALIGCYNTSYMSLLERNRVMLASAKRNLAAMAFFALTEYQKIGQYVFEETFNLRFAVPFEQHNATLSKFTLATLTSAQLKKIKELNSLDIELYEFAQTLMYKRFNKLKSRDPMFVERFNNLGRLPGRTEFNWDQALDEPKDTTLAANT